MALANQLAAMASSCGSYDAGNAWEATRIATAIHVIVHDGGKNNTSLLTQVGLKPRLKFVATGKAIDGRNLLRDVSLASIRVYGDGRAEYRPQCPDFQPELRLLSFNDWWERDLILRDRSFTLTRKRLTFNLRNIEGGAHYEGLVRDPNYLRFSQEHLTTPYVIKGTQLPKPILGAELASMRQMAWELSKSLEGHL
jgi:hypothetical protein